MIKDKLGDSQTKVIICTNELIYPPEDLREEIIKNNHDSIAAGHRGCNKTIKRIRSKYHWENLKTDVANYISRCLICQKKRLVRVKTRQPMTLTTTPPTAMDTVAIDVVGPLEATSNGNQYIFTIQDLLTKYCLAIPIPDFTSKTIADAFIKYYISYFGSPRILLSDNGTNFISKFMKRIAKRFKIKQVFITPYHAQSNGSLERSHHVLMEYIKKFVGETGDWDEYLPLATFSYNTNVQDSTKSTPDKNIRLMKKIRRSFFEMYFSQSNSNGWYSNYRTKGRIE